jgi:hypothetical protein
LGRRGYSASGFLRIAPNLGALAHSGGTPRWAVCVSTIRKDRHDFFGRDRPRCGSVTAARHVITNVDFVFLDQRGFRLFGAGVSFGAASVSAINSWISRCTELSV